MGFRELRHSGRRAFLRTTGGGALTLPLLELTHGRAFAQGSVPKRFLTLFSHGGTISHQGRSRGNGIRHDGTGGSHARDWFRPADPGEPLRLGPIMEGIFDRHVGEMVVFTGIDNTTAIDHDPYDAGGHKSANVSCLTATVSADGENSRGPSIDQVVASRLVQSQPTRFESVHLNVAGHQYGSPYFRAAGQRINGEEDPRVAFDTLLGDVQPDGSAPDPEVARRRLRRSSVLDGVREGLAVFRNSASAADMHVVDAHLEHIRAIERELEVVPTTAMCSPPGSPGSVDGTEARAPLLADIMVAALRCGVTNVANLEIADIITNWTPNGGIMEASFNIGHSLHHMARDIGEGGDLHGRYDDWMNEMLENRRWRMGIFKRVLDGLADVPEGDGTMLSNSLALLTSEFSNGSQHIAWNQPVALFGSAGGAIQTGRHINYNPHDSASSYHSREYETQESIHNLFTSVLRAFGFDDEHFGDDTARRRGPLPELAS